MRGYFFIVLVIIVASDCKDENTIDPPAYCILFYNANGNNDDCPMDNKIFEEGKTVIRDKILS